MLQELQERVRQWSQSFIPRAEGLSFGIDHWRALQPPVAGLAIDFLFASTQCPCPWGEHKRQSKPSCGSRRVVAASHKSLVSGSRQGRAVISIYFQIEGSLLLSLSLFFMHWTLLLSVLLLLPLIANRSECAFRRTEFSHSFA